MRYLFSSGLGLSLLFIAAQTAMGQIYTGNQHMMPVSYEDAAPATEMPGACDIGCTDVGVCDVACCDPCCDPCCNACGGIGCMHCMFDDVDIGGWISAGYYDNAHNANGNGANGPLGTVDDPYFQFDQVWGYVEKTVDTGGCGFDWGGRVDYVFGADGPDTQCFGDESWDFGWNTGNYGSAIPQGYFEVGYNNLKVKGGHFYTIIGYEVFTAPDNFFYSHSYSMYYGEPFTHSGFLGEYTVNDEITVYGGWVNGWDAGYSNQFGDSMALGGVTYAPFENASLTYAFTAGTEGPRNAGNPQSEVYMHSFVFQWDMTDRMTYIAQHDMGNVNQLTPGAHWNAAAWWSLNQYALYEINDCWGAGLRFEWFRDDKGTRVTGDGNGANFFEVTAGLNWTPYENLIVRPEIRGDWTQGGVVPFDNDTKPAQLSGGVDFIYTF